MKKLLLFIIVISVVAFSSACSDSYEAHGTDESTIAPVSVSDASESSSASSKCTASKVLKNSSSETTEPEGTSAASSSAVKESSNQTYNESSVLSPETSVTSSSSTGSPSRQPAGSNTSQNQTAGTTTGKEINTTADNDLTSAAKKATSSETSRTDEIATVEETTAATKTEISSTETHKPSAPETTTAPAEPETTAHTHCYVSSVTRNASCTNNGTITYSCSCGASYTESIPATGHCWAEITETVKVYVCTCTHADAYGNRDCWYQASSETSGPDALKKFRVHSQTHSDGAGYTFQDSYTYEKGTGNYRCNICGAAK